MSEYGVDAEWEVARWEYNYGLLPPEHKAMLPGAVERGDQWVFGEGGHATIVGRLAGRQLLL